MTKHVQEIVPYDGDRRCSSPEHYEQLDVVDGTLRKITERAEGWTDTKVDNGVLDGIPFQMFVDNLAAQQAKIQEKHPGANSFSIEWHTSWDHAEIQLQYLRPLTQVEQSRYDAWKKQVDAKAAEKKKRDEANELAELARLTVKYKGKTP